MTDSAKLTNEIQAKAKELFGYEIDMRALTLIPYLLFVLPKSGIAGAVIELDKITDDDRYWLRKWTNENRIKWSPPHLIVTKEFYVAAHELQWMAYINHEDVK